MSAHDNATFSGFVILRTNQAQFSLASFEVDKANKMSIFVCGARMSSGSFGLPDLTRFYCSSYFIIRHGIICCVLTAALFF